MVIYKLSIFVLKFSMRFWLSSNKNFFSNKRHDIYLGFKKAYSISLLPLKVELFHSHYLTRIFRVLGGLSIGLVLTGKYELFPKTAHIVIFILSLMHAIFIIIIFCIKAIYGLYIIIKRPDIFEVRNSPLNNFASHLARVLVCAKYACQGMAGGTGVLAAAITYDTILEASGRDKVFVPFIAKLFNDVYGHPMNTQHQSNLNTAVNNVTPDDKDHHIAQEYASLNPQQKEELIKIVQEHINKIKKN